MNHFIKFIVANVMIVCILFVNISPGIARGLDIDYMDSAIPLGITSGRDKGIIGTFQRVSEDAKFQHGAFYVITVDHTKKKAYEFQAEPRGNSDFDPLLVLYDSNGDFLTSSNNKLVGKLDRGIYFLEVTKTLSADDLDFGKFYNYYLRWDYEDVNGTDMKDALHWSHSWKKIRGYFGDNSSESHYYYSYFTSGEKTRIKFSPSLGFSSSPEFKGYVQVYSDSGEEINTSVILSTSEMKVYEFTPVSNKIYIRVVKYKSSYPSGYSIEWLGNNGRTAEEEKNTGEHEYKVNDIVDEHNLYKHYKIGDVHVKGFEFEDNFMYTPFGSKPDPKCQYEKQEENVYIKRWEFSSDDWDETIFTFTSYGFIQEYITSDGIYVKIQFTLQD